VPQVKKISRESYYNVKYTQLALHRLRFPPHCAISPIGPWPPHCRGFTTTLRHTALGWTPLDEWSARRRDNKQHSQQTDIYAPGGNRTHNSSKRAAADPSLRPRGHWDRSLWSL